MRSWYEFGYNGFPTGEQRRRFYRQRDDPCDSEEERDYDDETNDRPIFYYPLRESEEGSRSSCNSASSASYSSNEENGVGQVNHGGNTGGGASRTRRHHKSFLPSSPEETTVHCVVHSTLYEDMPAWYGATAVPLVTPAVRLPTTDMVTLQYGGAPCASPFAISNQVSVWHWSTAPSVGRLGGHARDDASGSLRCVRVRDDATFLSRLRWDRLHPLLRLAHGSAARLPPRIGHCAASLVALDSSLLQFFLTDHLHQHSHGHNRNSFTGGTANTDQEGRSSTANAVPGLLMDEEVEVYGSLVIGGAAQLVDASNGGSGSSSLGTREGTGARRWNFAYPTGPNLDGVVIPHTSILSHPSLCITLLSKDGDVAISGSAKLRQHTVVFPLDTPPMSFAAPRAFATLTPWADSTAEAAAIRSFAYLGGTENGRDPLAFLELEVFQLHLETWALSCSPVTTYGAKPAPRFGHSANMVDNNRFLLMFGGVGMGHVYLNDLHVLDVRTRVWREVFIPLGLEVPRRAFHMSAVLTTPSFSSDWSITAASSPSLDTKPHLSAFMAQARIALQFSSGLAVSTGHFNMSSEAGIEAGRSQEVKRGHEQITDDDNDENGDIWSSSVTTAQSWCTLVLLGGESDGGQPVTVSWACSLRNSKWQRLSFPLHSLPHFSHVATSWLGAESGAVTPQHVRRQLSRMEFRAVLDSLLERTARATPCNVDSTFLSSPLDHSYVAACHGSLAQLLHCPHSAHGAERLIVVGGSRGPPVSVATQLELVGTRLKDRASLWLLAVHQQGLLASAIQQRVQHLSRLFFHDKCALSRAVGSVFHSGNAEVGQQQRRRPLSAADVRSNRLINESVLAGQMAEWMQLARKRLRDCD